MYPLRLTPDASERYLKYLSNLLDEATDRNLLVASWVSIHKIPKHNIANIPKANCCFTPGQTSCYSLWNCVLICVPLEGCSNILTLGTMQPGRCWVQFKTCCLLQRNNPPLTANNGQKSLDITRHSCGRYWHSHLHGLPYSVKITSKTCCQWCVLMAARPHMTPRALCIYRKRCCDQLSRTPRFEI